MAPDKPRIKRLWLRRLAWAITSLIVLLALAAVLAVANLTFLARWAVQRALPSAKVVLGEVAFKAPGELRFQEFVLKDPATNETVLELESGSFLFSFDDIRQLRIGEIRFINPRIIIAPNIGKLFTATGNSQSSGRIPFIRRIVCDYGEATAVVGGDPSLHVRANFSFDWRDFGSDLQAPLSLNVWDLRAAAEGSDTPLLVLHVITLAATIEGLRTEGKVLEATIQGGNLAVGASLQNFVNGFSTGSKKPSPAFDWNLGKLDIRDLRVELEADVAEKRHLNFAFNTTLRNLSLAQARDELSEEMQMVELSNIEVLSPLDPLTKVLTMRSIFVRFNLAGLLRKELEEITILNPTIYVGPDLFWYMEDTQKRLGTGSADTSGTNGWTIHTVEVRLGRLVIGSGGRTQYGLPLTFQTSLKNVALNNLATLKLEGALEIPAQSYPFPAYQLDVTTEPGELRFAYPREKNADNLVGTIKITDILWRQYRAQEAWISTTFDRHGINGQFGGKAYRGYVSGGFSFFFAPMSPWIGWVSGKKVDLKKLTNAISPQNFSMTGPLDFRLQVDAFARVIDRLKGDFRTLQPGRMKIGKLDDLLEKIPDTWSSIKKSSARIGLEALRDFDYDTGRGDFWFVQDQGIFDLKLQGPQGSRKFQIVLHADDSPLKQWKKTTTP